MAMLCRDICKGFLPPAENFDYGLWIPAGKFRHDSDFEIPDSEPEPEVPVAPTSDTPAAPAADATPPPPEVVVEPKAIAKAIAAVTGGKSTCTIDEAANVARKLGYAPSNAEVKAFQAKKGASGITENDIQDWLKTCSHNDTVEVLIKFFQLYDKANKGTLTKTQMSYLLRTYGEPLTDAEFNAIASSLGMTGDEIDYAKFVKKLIAEDGAN